jgi:hypothetical protein
LDSTNEIVAGETAEAEPGDREKELHDDKNLHFSASFVIYSLAPTIWHPCYARKPSDERNANNSS